MKARKNGNTATSKQIGLRLPRGLIDAIAGMTIPGETPFKRPNLARRLIYLAHRGMESVRTDDVIRRSLPSVPPAQPAPAEAETAVIVKELTVREHPAVVDVYPMPKVVTDTSPIVVGMHRDGLIDDDYSLTWHELQADGTFRLLHTRLILVLCSTLKTGIAEVPRNHVMEAKAISSPRGDYIIVFGCQATKLAWEGAGHAHTVIASGVTIATVRCTACGAAMNTPSLTVDDRSW
jgi:hypothetical protein